jgi:putative transposase
MAAVAEKLSEALDGELLLSEWTKSGVLIRINDLLRRRVRTEVEEQQNVEATGDVIDTQSVRSTEAGGPARRFDGGKLVNGRKRNMLVDTLGLLMALRAGAQPHHRGGSRGQHLWRGIRLKKVWADKTFRGAKAWMKRSYPD